MAMRKLVAFLKAVQVVDDLEAVYVHADDAVAALGVGVHGLCRLRVEGVHVVQIGQEIESRPGRSSASTANGSRCRRR